MQEKSLFLIIFDTRRSEKFETLSTFSVMYIQHNTQNFFDFRNFLDIWKINIYLIKLENTNNGKYWTIYVIV